MEENRCMNCIWYEDCQRDNVLDDDCTDLDPIEDSEDYWLEMSYRKFERK